MKNLRLLLSAFCVFAAVESVAKETASSSRREVVSDDSADMNRWDTDVYLNYAFSMKSNFTNPNSEQFNTVTEGNTDNAKLGDAVGLGIAVNYNVCDWFTLGVSGELYTPFSYALAHTAGGSVLATSHATAGAAEVLGGLPATANGDSGAYLRSFTLNHQSFMFNAYLHLPERLTWGVGHMNISPLIGGGVGVGLNKVTNFQSTGWSTSTATTGLLQYTTIGFPNLKASVAGQATAGLNFQPEGSDVSWGVAYRFYYGGKFNTGTAYQLNDTNNLGEVATLNAWTGRLMTNQVAMFLNFEF